jgi:hypothetical protein
LKNLFGVVLPNIVQVVLSERYMSFFGLSLFSVSTIQQQASLSSGLGMLPLMNMRKFCGLILLMPMRDTTLS